MAHLTVDPDEPYSAATVALSRLLRGYSREDREDIRQEVALAAARADASFEALGLQPVKSGRAGYQLRRARWKATEALKKTTQTNNREVRSGLDLPDTWPAPQDPIAAVERGFLIDAVLADVDEYCGEEHAAVAHQILAKGSETRALTSRAPRLQARACGIVLRLAEERVTEILRDLEAYFTARRPIYLGL